MIFVLWIVIYNNIKSKNSSEDKNEDLFWKQFSKQDFTES